MLRGIQKLLDRLYSGISWLALLLVFLFTGDVALRYLGHQSYAWLSELEWHVYAVLFMLGLSYAMRQDRHVRVDIWYSRRSLYQRSWINLLGHILLLLPWLLILFYVSQDYVANSYFIHEASPEPNGLPARYLIKSVIPLAVVLLGIQWLLQCVEYIYNIKSRRE